MSVNLAFNELVKSLFGVDLDSLVDPTNFYFDERFEATEDELIEAVDIVHPTLEYEDLEAVPNIEKIGDAIASVKAYQYESSYIDEQHQYLCKLLEYKVTTVFNEIADWLSNEIYDLNVIHTDVTVDADPLDNEVTILDGCETLKAIIVICINGYGQFHYESVQEFDEVNDYPDTDQARVESHIGWLKHFDSIWGMHVLEFDPAAETQHRSFGNIDYTQEALTDELLERGLIES